MRVRTRLEAIESLDPSTQELLLREATRTVFGGVPPELAFLRGRFVDLGFENLGLGTQKYNDVLRAFSGTGVALPNSQWRLRFFYPYAVVEAADRTETEALPTCWQEAVIVFDDRFVPTWIGNKVRQDQIAPLQRNQSVSPLPDPVEPFIGKLVPACLPMKATRRPNMADRSCHDCGAEPGDLHTPGCDVERCPNCGGQLISCGCRPHTLLENVPRRMPWTGEWPGLAECRELNLWCVLNQNGPGWVPCHKDHPGASEDLNRLIIVARWDKDLQKWVARVEPS